ncbi:MAG: hypothetical protein WA980_16070 [Shinella zoogloeoides]|uniref:hypothetical protein n=1 Tax=Shinella zoogloeoides TaxID=352475 RepID=UPI003C74A1E9
MKKAEQLTDDELCWLWAYNEQLSMLDRYDARWIELSRSEWSDKEIAKFLKTYGLIRGKTGKIVFSETNKHNRIDFYKVCRDIFRPMLEKNVTLEDTDKIWKSATRAISGKFGNGINLFSAVSKLQWFHFPESWIMFDSQNRSALATWLTEREHSRFKSHLTVETFSADFQKFYEYEGKKGAAFASTFFARRYPYSLRVAEKYLWLRGCKETERHLIVSSYRASLRIAPLPACWTLSEAPPH